METSFKKRLMLGLSITSVLLLAACGGGDTGETDSSGDDTTEEIGTVGAMEDFKVGDTFVATEPLELEIIYRDYPDYPYDPDWMLFDVLEEKHNVSYTVNPVPLSDWNERLSVTLAAGDLPDYSTDAHVGDETDFIAGGILLPISKYVEHMPHFQARVAEWEGVEEQLDNIRYSDGEYYLLPGLRESPEMPFTLTYNKTIFEEHGLDVPQSWDELRTVLEVLRDETGKTPMTLWWQGNSLLSFAGASFNARGGWGLGDGAFYDRENDEFVFGPMQEGYKEMITYFAELTADGLLDVEALTQDDQAAQSKLANLDAFVSSGNVGTINMVNESMEELHGEGEYEFDRIPILEGPAGRRLTDSNFHNGIMLNANLAERDDFLAILQFLDWFHYSDEGSIFTNWGVEGVTFERTDELPGGYKPLGNISFEHFNVGADESLQKDYGFNNPGFAYGDPDDIALSIMSEEEYRAQSFMQQEVEIVNPDPRYPMDPVEQEQATLLSTPLTDTVDQYTFRFITGQASLDEWDTFMSELESQGADEFIELVNEAYRKNQENLNNAK